MMVRALANQCDAMVLDISPNNLQDKYNLLDKKLMAKMLYMVFTCAKHFQPAIILINDLEQLFPGGKGKKKKGGFARLKKPIQAFKKAKYIEQKDRVALIGCTNKPYDCSSKECRIYFDKKFYFPYPNYATR